MWTFFTHDTILQKGHHITSLHRGQTMRHDQRGAPFHQLRHGLRQGALRAHVQRGGGGSASRQRAMPIRCRSPPLSFMPRSPTAAS